MALMKAEKWKARLELGQEWEAKVSDFLISIGIENTHCTDFDTEADGFSWKRDSFDIQLNSGDVIEVKSRSFKRSFTCPEDFPYDDIFVDSLTHYDAKANKPLLYIFVCQKTGNMLWLSTDTADLWTDRYIRDVYSGYRYRVYCAPKHLLKPMSELPEFLNGRISPSKGSRNDFDPEPRPDHSEEAAKR